MSDARSVFAISSDVSSGTSTNKRHTKSLSLSHHAVVSFDDSSSLMGVERRHSMLFPVLSKLCIDGVTGGDLVVFEGVHVIDVDASIKVRVSKLSKVDLANCILDVLPIEGISGLRSRNHSCDTVNTSHFFLLLLIIKNNYKLTNLFYFIN